MGSLVDRRRGEGIGDVTEPIFSEIERMTWGGIGHWKGSSSHDTALAGANEGQEFRDFRGSGEGGFELFNRLAGVELGAVEDAVGLFDGLDGGGVKATTFEADGIDPAGFGRIAVCKKEGGNVLDDFGAATSDGVASDPAKLMDAAHATDDGVVVDFDMPGEGAVVGEDDMVADGAVMGDMGVSEEVAVVADARFASDAGGAVDGAEFPKHVAVTDAEMGRFALVFEILGAMADGGEGIKKIATPDFGGAVDDDVALEVTILSEEDVGADDAIRADADAFAERGGGIDDGSGMDTHGGSFSGRGDQRAVRPH